MASNLNSKTLLTYITNKTGLELADVLAIFIGDCGNQIALKSSTGYPVYYYAERIFNHGFSKIIYNKTSMTKQELLSHIHSMYPELNTIGEVLAIIFDYHKDIYTRKGFSSPILYRSSVFPFINKISESDNDIKPLVTSILDKVESKSLVDPIYGECDESQTSIPNSVYDLFDKSQDPGYVYCPRPFENTLKRKLEKTSETPESQCKNKMRKIDQVTPEKNSTKQCTNTKLRHFADMHTIKTKTDYWYSEYKCAHVQELLKYVCTKIHPYMYTVLATGETRYETDTDTEIIDDYLDGYGYLD